MRREMVGPAITAAGLVLAGTSPLRHAAAWGLDGSTYWREVSDVERSALREPTMTDWRVCLVIAALGVVVGVVVDILAARREPAAGQRAEADSLGGGLRALDVAAAVAVLTTVVSLIASASFLGMTVPVHGTVLAAGLAAEHLAVRWALRRVGDPVRASVAAAAQVLLLAPLVAWVSHWELLGRGLEQVAVPVGVPLGALVVFTAGAVVSGRVVPGRVLTAAVVLAVGAGVLLWAAGDPWDVWSGAFVGEPPLCLAIHRCAPGDVARLQAQTWVVWLVGAAIVVAGAVWWARLLRRRHPAPPLPPAARRATGILFWGAVAAAVLGGGFLLVGDQPLGAAVLLLTGVLAWLRVLARRPEGRARS